MQQCARKMRKLSLIVSSKVAACKKSLMLGESQYNYSAKMKGKATNELELSKKALASQGREEIRNDKLIVQLTKLTKNKINLAEGGKRRAFMHTEVNGARFIQLSNNRKDYDCSFHSPASWNKSFFLACLLLASSSSSSGEV